MRNLLLLLILGVGTAAFSFELSTNFWEDGESTFYVGFAGLSPSGISWNAAFEDAMAEWSDRTDFQFNVINEYLDPCTDREDGALGDGATGVDFQDTICGTEFGSNVVAINLNVGYCLVQGCKNNAFRTTDSDIIFKASENWDVYSGPPQNDLRDFNRIAVHELGHAIGLSHEDSGIESIMASFVGSIDSIQADDIAGVYYRYGDATDIATVYGLNIASPSFSQQNQASNVAGINGSLQGDDFAIDGKFIDIYQFSFDGDSDVVVELNSNSFNTFLYLVRITSTQDPIDANTYSDDNSSIGTNSIITESIPAGTYWVAVSSSQLNQTGDYSISMTADKLPSSNGFDTYDSIYGVDVQINPNPNIEGYLASSDFKLDGRPLDVYQFEVTSRTNMRFDLDSEEFDTDLLLVEILPDENQAVGDVVLENDNISFFNSNSRIEQSLHAGTYWIGVTSPLTSALGNYEIEISVLP